MGGLEQGQYMEGKQTKAFAASLQWHGTSKSHIACGRCAGGWVGWNKDSTWRERRFTARLMQPAKWCWMQLPKVGGRPVLERMSSTFRQVGRFGAVV
jgi:hypothetical protein